jgi:Mg-chelatase subunit ChlI
MRHDTAHDGGRVPPFTALVGQEALARALIMLAVNPRLQGVLVRGERGTAKSTAARALARLLPPAGAAGLAGRPAPFVTLPLGITEDQLLGTLDLEHALRTGERRFDPGLLAAVHGGLPYVDEVNLLEDHLVDLLLDVAQSGTNVVARDGVTHAHPAAFVLVGTMNPEEGELRPQLVDRFGLSVEVRGLSDLEARAEVIARVLAFEADPTGFHAAWRAKEEALAARIVQARALLEIAVPDRALCLAAARVALSLGADGHRADLLMVKGALTLAALDGRREATLEDLADAAALALPHRLRGDPFDGDSPSAAEIRERACTAAAEPPTQKKKAR